MSPPATRLLLDLIARSLANAKPGFASVSGADDLGIQIILTRHPGVRSLVHGADGDFTLDGLSLAVGVISAREEAG